MILIIMMILVSAIFSPAFSQRRDKRFEFKSNRLVVFQNFFFTQKQKEEDTQYIRDSLNWNNSSLQESVYFERKEKNLVIINEFTGNIYLSGTYCRHFTIINFEKYNGYTLYRISGGQVQVHHHKVFVEAPGLDLIYFVK